jgi:hypothetical protein
VYVLGDVVENSTDFPRQLLEALDNVLFQS